MALSREDIAAMGFCWIDTPPVTKTLIDAGLSAKSEIYTVPEDRQHHAFSVVPHEENPDDDTVYDPHYLQFLPSDLRSGRENVFIGRRGDIIALMAAHAKTNTNSKVISTRDACSSRGR
jgi:hypothetical protein